MVSDDTMKGQQILLIVSGLFFTYVEARANIGTCGKYRKLNHQEDLESQGEAEQPSTENHPPLG